MTAAYIWPIALVVVSNIAYQICAKSVPSGLNPLASVMVTYLVGAAASAVAYFLICPTANLAREFRSLNWAPFGMGLVVVGLEVGFIYAYKAGWQVSTASIVQSAFLAVALLAVGALLYREPITRNRVIGIVLCLAGLFFLNR